MKRYKVKKVNIKKLKEYIKKKLKNDKSNR